MFWSADEYAIPEPLEYHMGVNIELRRQRVLEVHTLVIVPREIFFHVPVACFTW